MLSRFLPISIRGPRPLLALGLALALMPALSCKTSYPRCKADTDCKSHDEVCVNGQCQECSTNAHCALKYPGQPHTCVDGRCEKGDCSTDTDCKAHGDGWVCRTGHCTPECTHEADCGPGKKCVSQRCVASCAQDAECPLGYACVDGVCEDAATALRHGHVDCRPTKAGDAVNLPTVNFEFNQYDLTPATRETLAEVLHCLKQAPANLEVLVEGHCDDRGTQEYNLALGERRAQAVLKYLRSLGVTSSRLEPVSKGENEPLCAEKTEACFAQNRRVQFVQKIGL